MNAQPYESLPGALAALDDALHALIGPQSQVLGDRVVGSPSRYKQLQEATEGEQSNSGGGGGLKSRPPGWLDAFQLRDEIDQAVAILQPAFDGVPATVGRLRWFRKRGFRPQDCHLLEQVTTALNEWAADIDELLYPPSRLTPRVPCPACGALVVYRRDGDDLVRKSALQLTTEGCSCAKCRAYWPPSKFVFLASVLGSLPPEVVA